MDPVSLREDRLDHYWMLNAGDDPYYPVTSSVIGSDVQATNRLTRIPNFRWRRDADSSIRTLKREASFWPTAACRTGMFRSISMPAFDESRHSKSTNLYTVRTAES